VEREGSGEEEKGEEGGKRNSRDRGGRKWKGWRKGTAGGERERKSR